MTARTAARLAALGLAGASIAAPWADESARLLPLEALQGRSMDARLVDLDADGRLDLIVASEFGQNVVLLAGPDGFANARNALPRGRMHDSEDIGVGDLDGNGLLDVVFVSEDDQTNEMYLQTEPGVFTDASDRLPAPGGISNAVLVIDVDRDGDLDLILGNQGQNVVLFNDGQGRFTPDTEGRLPADTRVTQHVAAGDVDADGDLDLVFANEDGNRVLINDGRGFFNDETEARLPDLPVMETRDAELVDLNADGHPDLLLANVGWRPGNDPANRLLINDGTGRFTDESAARLPPNTLTTLDCAVADLNDDGHPDIVCANMQGMPVQVWINDGSGRFTDRTAEWIPPLKVVSALHVVVIDVNADGRPDIYVANHAGADRLLIAAE